MEILIFFFNKTEEADLGQNKLLPPQRVYPIGPPKMINKLQEYANNHVTYVRKNYVMLHYTQRS